MANMLDQRLRHLKEEKEEKDAQPQVKAVNAVQQDTALDGTAVFIDGEEDIRPEDIDIVPYGKGLWNGTIISKLFIGVHYEMLVQSEHGKVEWLLQNYDQHDVGEKIGMYVDPENIQIMHKPKSEAEHAIELDL